MMDCKLLPLRTAAIVSALFMIAAHSTSTSPAHASAAQDTLDVAMRYFRAAERFDPSKAQLERYHEAEKLAEEAVAMDPNSADAHFLIFAARGRQLLAGNPLSNVWQLRSLNEHLDHALQLNPGHAQALAAKGGLLLGLPSFLGGDVKAATGYLEKAVALNPTGPGTRVELARAFIRQGHYQEAKHQLLLAGHYACLTRRTSILNEATELLSELEKGSL